MLGWIGGIGIWTADEAPLLGGARRVQAPDGHAVAGRERRRGGQALGHLDGDEKELGGALVAPAGSGIVGEERLAQGEEGVEEEPVEVGALEMAIAQRLLVNPQPL